MAWTTPRTWTDGELVTKAIMDTHVRDNLNFLHTRPRGLWVPPVEAEGAGVVFPSRYNFHPSAELVDGQSDSAYFSFSVPAEFTTLSKAVVVLIAAGTGNLRRSMDMQYGADGEAYNNHVGAIGVGLVAVTTGQFKEDNIATALASLAAGDHVGFQFARDGGHVDDTVGASVHLLGVWIEYY